MIIIMMLIYRLLFMLHVEEVYSMQHNRSDQLYGLYDKGFMLNIEVLTTPFFGE